MARLSDQLIDKIKQDVSLVALVEAMGIKGDVTNVIKLRIFYLQTNKLPSCPVCTKESGKFREQVNNTVKTVSSSFCKSIFFVAYLL